MWLSQNFAMFCRDEFGERVYVDVRANQLGGDASPRVNSLAIGLPLDPPGIPQCIGLDPFPLALPNTTIGCFPAKS